MRLTWFGVKICLLVLVVSTSFGWVLGYVQIDKNIQQIKDSTVSVKEVRQCYRFLNLGKDEYPDERVETARTCLANMPSDIHSQVRFGDGE